MGVTNRSEASATTERVRRDAESENATDDYYDTGSDTTSQQNDSTFLLTSAEPNEYHASCTLLSEDEWIKQKRAKEGRPKAQNDWWHDQEWGTPTPEN